MSKRRYGLAAVIGVGVTALLGVPQVIAQDAGSEPATAAEADGADGEGVVTYSADDAEGSRGRTAAADSDIEFVALGAGCRVFDSRNDAEGPLINGQERTYSLKDADLSGQGSLGGACGVPDSAVAVDMSLSTVANSPTGFGFIRAGQGSATPTATVLQFLKKQGTSVSTTVSMNAAQQIRLVASGADTDMVGDVVGYWERTLHATINADGTLERGSGVESVRKHAAFTGSYYVTFERDVSECTPVASGAPSSVAIIATARLYSPTSTPKEVFLRIRDAGGGNSDRDFQLAMEC